MAEQLLSDIYKQARGNMPEETIKKINLELLLLVQLSSLQQNIAFDIEQEFRKHSQYKMTIKHNHEKIKSLIRGSSNSKFWERLNQEQIDDICDDQDSLEDVVLKWAGLKK